MRAAKYLAFDIETAQLAPDGDSRDAAPALGIACWAVAWVGHDGRIVTTCGHGATRDGTPAPQMRASECSDLVQRLCNATRKGFTLLTHNGCGFDFPILAQASGLHGPCADLALHHVDMMLHVHCLKGFPVGLDAVARGMGLAGKSAGMSGALAPQMWAEGRHAEVLRYVAQDARTTLAVALAVERRKGLRWIAKSGRTHLCPLLQWLTVAEALRLPEPDVSWMREPWPRSRFTAWIEA